VVGGRAKRGGKEDRMHGDQTERLREGGGGGKTGWLSDWAGLEVVYIVMDGQYRLCREDAVCAEGAGIRSLPSHVPPKHPLHTMS